MMKLVRNQKGLSIVEVLVAAGLTAVVSLGIATMIQNSMIEQKKVVLLSTLREKKIAIESMLRDQNAWNNTIRQANNLALTPANQSTTCLVNSTACGVIAATAPQKLIVLDAAGGVAFNLLTWAGAGSNGFTEGGAACTGFSATAGAGSDACPISYRIVYQYTCPSGTSCVNPQIKIVGRLIFNPSTSGVLNRFRGLIAQGDLTTIADDDAPGMGRYDVLVKRTSVQTNRQFRIAMQFNNPSGSDCSNAGFGQCFQHSTNFGNYPAGRTWNYEDDADNLITVSGQTWQFNANQDGPYSCIITSQAFSTGGFQVQLLQGSTVLATTTTTAGQWAASTAILETRFIANTGVNYSLRNRCNSLPGGTPNANLCTLGMLQTYNSTPVDFVTVSCYKVDKDL